MRWLFPLLAVFALAVLGGCDPRGGERDPDAGSDGGTAADAAGCTEDLDCPGGSCVVLTGQCNYPTCDIANCAVDGDCATGHWCYFGCCIPEADGGATDGGATDGGATDGGATDGGATDGGATDGGATDGGATDGGATDGGATDGGATDGGTGPNESRFIIMGDQGTGSVDQYAVAGAIETLCRASGCDFIILAGDNFYDDGVTSVTDALWDSYFEAPYANLDGPFHPVIGNHDYGSIPIFWAQGQVEVDYTTSPGSSGKWQMPATFYTMDKGPVGFMMLDTASIFLQDTTNGDQTTWYNGAVATLASKNWIIGVGHHPYKSNGRHGNAGNYEAPFGILDPTGQIPGRFVKEFFDTYVCGTVDMYVCGHDHNRQWLDEKLCGAELIVSGAGAKTTDFEHNDNNATAWEDDTTEGFLYVVVDGNTLTGQFWDKNGNLDFERTLTK